MQNLLILSRDVLSFSASNGNQSLKAPNDQALKQNVANIVNSYAIAGWGIFVGSNELDCSKPNRHQPGEMVKSLHQVIGEMQFLMGLLPGIINCYFCPDENGARLFGVSRQGSWQFQQPEWTYSYKKPKPGMLLAIIQSYKAMLAPSGAAGYMSQFPAPGSDIKFQKVIVVDSQKSNKGAADAIGAEFVLGEHFFTI
jgi:histidinol phosphatase-like enzyme